MFSNPKHSQTPPTNLNNNHLNQKRSISPSTKPTNYPMMSSFKTLATVSPKSQTNLTKLTPLLQPQIPLGHGINSRIVTLVSANDGSLHFHAEADNVLQRYQGNDVCFVGIWGSENSDKGFFCDRVLGLCEVDGDKYVNAGISNPNALLYMYQRPFIKDNLRYFLICPKGPKSPANLSQPQKSQLDILMSICQEPPNSTSSNPPADILQQGYQHINQSFNRLYIDKRRKKEQPVEICWPRSLFVLYNTTESIRSGVDGQTKQKEFEQELCRMFKDYSFSILHNRNVVSEQQVRTYTTITNPLQQLYLKNTSIIFRQIHQKMHPKSYLNIRYTGLTTPHILAQTVYTLNLHQNLYLPKTFHKAKRSIFSSIYNHHAIAYLPKMKQYIPEEKSYSTDYLLNAFRNVGGEVMEEYLATQGEVVVRPGQESLCGEYQRKLEEYIEEKERAILAINGKKSYKELKKLLTANSSNANTQQELKRVKKSLLQPTRSYDNNAQTLYVANTIKSLLSNNMSKNNGKLFRSQFGETVTYGTPQQLSPQQIIQKVVDLQLEKEPSVVIREREREQAEIGQKKSVLMSKKQQLQKLQTVINSQAQQLNRQIATLKTQQKSLQAQLQAQQERLQKLRESQMSHSQGGSQLVPNPAATAQLLRQIQQLKHRLQQMAVETQQAQKIPMNPQESVIRSQISKRKEELQKLTTEIGRAMLVTTAQPGAFGAAERRVINARDANIRRVHGSRV